MDMSEAALSGKACRVLSTVNYKLPAVKTAYDVLPKKQLLPWIHSYRSEPVKVFELRGPYTIGRVIRAHNLHETEMAATMKEAAKRVERKHLLRKKHRVAAFVPFYMGHYSGVEYLAEN